MQRLLSSGRVEINSLCKKERTPLDHAVATLDYAKKWYIGGKRWFLEKGTEVPRTNVDDVDFGEIEVPPMPAVWIYRLWAMNHEMCWLIHLLHAQIVTVCEEIVQTLKEAEAECRTTFEFEWPNDGTRTPCQSLHGYWKYLGDAC